MSLGDITSGPGVTYDNRTNRRDRTATPSRMRPDAQVASVLDLVDQLDRYGDWRDGEIAELILDAIDGKLIRFRR